jgi:hopanoid biosynthesis associated radical SAM protein HpnH
VGIPLRQVAKIGTYVLRQHLAGRKRYPLVLMLEPLFRCNLACAGCGKIDYPEEILNKRISVRDALYAAEECGAPIVSIAGGEPLIHKELPEIVRGLIEQGRFVILCTNALLLEKKIREYEPSPYFTWSIHLDGDREMHDRSVCREGVYDKAVAALKLAKEKGFRATINCTIFNNAEAARVADFFDTVTAMGVDGITMSPGYAYERAPDQKHFLNRRATKELFRGVFRRGRGGKAWPINQSGLFIDFLAGNQEYHCTPWGNPTRTVFGWQRPCYLLGEGYTKTFKELMEDTDWEKYGTGNYEKCADCMVHCGYEASAVSDTVRRPWKAAWVALKGVRTEGPLAPEISLTDQRPAEYVFSRNVAEKLDEIRQTTPNPKKISTAA